MEASAPRFDDSLFYGAMNKAAHIIELKFSGYEFIVLPKVFATQVLLVFLFEYIILEK